MVDLCDVHEVSAELSQVTAQLRDARDSALDQFRRSIEFDTWIHADGVEYQWPGGKQPTLSQYPHFLTLSPDEHRVLNPFCETHGLRIEGIGSGRVVLTSATTPDPQYVIKLGRYGPSALMGDGRAMNKLEHERWGALGSPQLAPVVHASSEFSWIVMPRATQLLTEADSHTTARVCADLQDFITDQISNTLIDVKPHNIGTLDGRWVLLDYGEPEKPTACT